MHRGGFTLLELLIVIAILAVLATVAVLVINPGEYLKQARDGKRVSDISAINEALAIAMQMEMNFGASTTISVSIPDSASSTCGSLGLPSLPSGYQYRCVSDVNVSNIDGTGWLPVDFRTIPGGSPFAKLPSDPSEDVAAGRYYYFVGNGVGGYVVAAGAMESEKYGPGGASDKTSGDGGSSAFALEMGTNANTYKTPNLLLNGGIDNIVTCAPGWDAALNGTVCPVDGFGSGYNGGVASPAIGYHAHVNATCGLSSTGCFEFIDLNSAYGYPHRWLGINQTIVNPAATLGWGNGTKIKVHFMAKTDTLGKNVVYGLYHWSNSAAAYTFSGAGPALASKTLSKAGDWEETSTEFAVTGDWEINTHEVDLYIYGNSGPEGKLWVDAVEMTYR